MFYSAFYLVTRQMKTITYSLASTKCMEEGWTVRPPSPSLADTEQIHDPFLIEVNPLQLVSAISFEFLILGNFFRHLSDFLFSQNIEFIKSIYHPFNGPHSDNVLQTARKLLTNTYWFKRKSLHSSLVGHEADSCLWFP